jgi:hypothetical protein
MNKLVVAVVVGAVGFGIWHWHSTSPPSASQVEPVLREYLASGASDNCSGTMTLDEFGEVSVGEYASQFGGWPVYVNHRETCHKGGSSMTYDGSQDADKHVAAAFVRRTATGRLEAFIPSFFADAQKEMQQSIQKALDSIPTK